MENGTILKETSFNGEKVQDDIILSQTESIKNGVHITTYNLLSGHQLEETLYKKVL